MTRKDYVRIAAALNAALTRLNPVPASEYLAGRRKGIEDATAYIVDALAADNPRFDGTRFWAAVEKGTAAS
jgi:hypothetical protein